MTLWTFTDPLVLLSMALRPIATVQIVRSKRKRLLGTTSMTTSSPLTALPITSQEISKSSSLLLYSSTKNSTKNPIQQKTHQMFPHGCSSHSLLRSPTECPPHSALFGP